MKNILQVIMTGILLLLTSHVIAKKPSFKDLQNLRKELGKEWQILVFEQANMATFLYAYKTREDYLGPEGYERRKELYLVEIPEKLKLMIFSKQIINPFKVLFPYIYTIKAQNLIKQCSKPPNNFYANRYFDFRGIQFELDDNLETTEWYITAPIEACFYAKYHHLNYLEDKYNDIGHNWLVQKQANGQYRILMESEGSTNIYNKKHQGYKDFTTQAYGNHIYRQKAKKDSDKYCWEAWISWKYKSGSYQPTRVAGLGCEYSDEKSKRIKQEKEVIIPLVLRWLNIYTPEPITVNEKKEVIPVNNVKNSQSSFNQDELNAINKLLH